MATVNSVQMRDPLAWTTGEDQPREPSSNPFVWFWEAVEGDFNEERSTSQIAMDAAISMIPLVDQLCDVRDLIANCRKLHRDIADSVAWIALALTLIGLFPTLGSLVKGVLKIFFAFLRRTGGHQATAAIDAAMTWVINFLRRQEVQKYLARLKVDEVFTWLSTEIKVVRAKLDVAPLLAAFDRVMNVIEGMVEKVAYVPAIGNKAKLVLVQVKQIRMHADAELGKALKPVRDMVDTIIMRLEKDIMVKQRGIVDVRNVHYRGVIPESTAVEMMQKLKPKWLTQSGIPKFPGLDIKDARRDMQPYTSTMTADGMRRDRKEIFPDLTNQNIESFHTLAAQTVMGPARLYRILSPNSAAMGDCWMSEEVFKKLQSAPDPREAWRKYLAVWPDWNVNGQFVIYDVKPGESLNLWRGIAASQTKAFLPGEQLEGGFEQIIIKISDLDTRKEVPLWYPNSNGILGNPITQKQVEKIKQSMDRSQIQNFYQTHIPIREKINHPNISGPFETGWGYTDFGGAGMSGRIGLPPLPGQLTTLKG